MSSPAATNERVLSARDKKIMLAMALREKRIRQARNNFWHFCKLMAPDFYRETRTHLKHLCDVLQRLYEGTLGGYKRAHSYIEQPYSNHDAASFRKNENIDTVLPVDSRHESDGTHHRGVV